MNVAYLRRSIAAVATVAALALGALPAISQAAPSATDRAAPSAKPCSAETRDGYARCMSRFRQENGGRLDARAMPPGYGAADLRAAYKVPATGAKTTVAIVIAFDVPYAEKDLAVYRKTMGLPPCTTANGCFTKLNQRGVSGSYPEPDPGWALEGSMDLDLVSAACPTCKIMLVESDDNSLVNMAEATRTAWRKGAQVISHSYGATEGGYVWEFRDAYEKRGVISVASSGDFGFMAASMPAVYRKVLAVGGTTLKRAPGTARGWDEDVWGGSGSACSAYIAKSPWQHDPHCQMRTVSDVSAVADPETGPAIYDSYENPFGLEPGWIIGGGTSASAPYVAGLIGLKGNASTFTSRTPYTRTSAFFDVVGGRNGICGGDYLCTGRAGYDAPTGIGSPNGLGGF